MIKLNLKILILLLSSCICNYFFSQSSDILEFNEREFNILLENACNGCDIENYSNKDYVQLYRNDSLITMSHGKGRNGLLSKQKGNYIIYYDFYPNLKIKSQTEFISAISRAGTLQVGFEKHYDEKGTITSVINFEKGFYDDKIPLPKKTIWEIRKQLQKDFNFDILSDKNLFGIQYTEPTKTSNKINYIINKFLGDDNDILRLEEFIYNGETGKFIETKKREIQLPEGGLPHY